MKHTKLSAENTTGASSTKTIIRYKTKTIAGNRGDETTVSQRPKRLRSSAVRGQPEKVKERGGKKKEEYGSGMRRGTKIRRP